MEHESPLESIRCPSCQGTSFNKEMLRAGDAVFEIFICRACGKRVTKARGVVPHKA